MALFNCQNLRELKNPFPREKLSKNGSTSLGRIHSHYGHAHSRYAQQQLQGRPIDVSKQRKSSVIQPILTLTTERSKNERDFKNSENQLIPLGEKNVPQTRRCSKCLFEDGNNRIYTRKKIKNMFAKQPKDAIYPLKACFNCSKLVHSSKEFPEL